MTEVSDGSVLAIDIGGTKVSLGIVGHGTLRERSQFATPRTGRGEDLVGAIALAADGLPDVSCIAVATTGIVLDGCLTALNPQTLPIEDRFPLSLSIENATGKRPFLVNDAQAAAWGEYRLGSGRGSRNFAFVTISTGVGAGIVADGMLLVGGYGLAGHLGHTVTDPSGPPCGCGRRGCLEAVASGSAIARMGAALFGRPVSSPDVFAMAASGDPQAEGLIVDSARHLALALGNLKATVDVDTVALGGGVGLAEGFVERVRLAVETLPAKFRCEVVTASAGSDAGLLGVADLAIANL